MRAATVALCVVAVAGAGMRATTSRVTLRATDQAGHPTNQSCGAAKDLVVQALEEMGPRSRAGELDDAVQLLKRASDLCGELGDAWYYRGLVETRLQHATRADFAFGQARMFASAAEVEGTNPFVLATPDARGVMAERTAPGPKPQESPQNRPAQKWALVVGIGQFSDRSIRQLKYTTSDADGFAAALRDPTIGQFAADHVRELKDAQATGKNIKEEINRIARQANANDLVVIYLATHGSPRSMDSVGGVNYLVTYDTEMFDQGKLDEDAMYATAFPMVELANAVSTRMKSLRTLVVLDTCYSGGSFTAPGTTAKVAAKAAGPTPQMLAKMGEGTGRIVMAASQADEPSLESATLGHGFFTYYLLQALKESGGKKTMTQIFSTVAEKVSRQAEAAGARQHPVIFQSSATADFSLLGPGPASAKISGRNAEPSLSARAELALR